MPITTVTWSRALGAAPKVQAWACLCTIGITPRRRVLDCRLSGAVETTQIAAVLPAREARRAGCQCTAVAPTEYSRRRRLVRFVRTRTGLVDAGAGSLAQFASLLDLLLELGGLLLGSAGVPGGSWSVSSASMPAWSWRDRSSSASTSAPNSRARFVSHSQSSRMITPASDPYVLLYEPKLAT